jgi:O-methyltransferase involved in polyketide biosynthesis
LSEDSEVRGSAGEPRLKVALEGVPETTLWTLYHRAKDSQRPGSRLSDPKAIELVEAIDFPFAEKFGHKIGGLDGWIGERALTFDQEVRSVLATDPAAMVAVLGEGLETQFWRLDNGQVRWLTVDLPETAAVRRALVGEDPPRRRLFAGSALDEDWFEVLGASPSDRVVVVAQGLLMYLPPREVEALIAKCAERFRGGVMLFDTVPAWTSWITRQGWAKSPSGYKVPVMSWGVDAGDHDRFRRIHPNIVGVRAVTVPRGPGALSRVLIPLGRSLPVIKRGMPSIVRLDFGA